MAAGLVVLTGLWIALLAVDVGRAHSLRRSHWLAILAGELRLKDP